MDLHILRCLEHDLTIFRKRLSVLIIKKDTGYNIRKTCIWKNTFLSDVRWNFKIYKTYGHSDVLIYILGMKIWGYLIYGAEMRTGEKLRVWSLKNLNEN